MVFERKHDRLKSPDFRPFGAGVFQGFFEHASRRVRIGSEAWDMAQGGVLPIMADGGSGRRYRRGRGRGRAVDARSTSSGMRWPDRARRALWAMCGAHIDTAFEDPHPPRFHSMQRGFR
ncbi:hypothetical protein [Mesorhizobium sp. M0522]|uniref:hypothetical protein n=1 Tax=Mesorhizobium sp. M0522 TaxID=2956958 RepID=UPI00333B7C32